MADRIRVLVVGVSEKPTCGVRDHATLLAEELERRGVACEVRWLSRSAGSLGHARSEFRAWTRELAARLARERPDVVLLHYSVFSYSHRGLPLFVAPVMGVLRRSGVPVVTVMHELAFPWRHGGLRGGVWALTQRAALAGVVRASSAVVVTAEFRAEWLHTRVWLPRRPVGLAPVFSNLPSPAVDALAERTGEEVVGLFGYAFEDPNIALVLDAMGALHARGRATRLLLLGSPGADSAPGRAWSQAAQARGLEDALSFSGTLAAQDLSNALAGCDVLLYADATGPASRKGTLAGSLASGRPLVAVDGPRRWAEVVDSAATLLVARTPQAIADALASLLGDAQAREALGARGGAFARERMGLARTGDVVAGFLADLTREGHGASRTRSAPPIRA